MLLHPGKKACNTCQAQDGCRNENVLATSGIIHVKFRLWSAQYPALDGVKLCRKQARGRGVCVWCVCVVCVVCVVGVGVGLGSSVHSCVRMCMWCVISVSM